MYPNTTPSSGSFNDQLVAVPPHTRGGGVPAVGWARVAFVINSLRELPSAVVIVETVDEERLVIDWGGRRFWWLSTGSALPEQPRIAGIRMARAPGSVVPTIRELPEPIDALLWHAGLLAFPGEIAPWLRADAAYRATGWPNFTVVAHGPEHVRMTALLSRRALTVEQLAKAARVEPSAASDFVNALALLDVVVDEDSVASSKIAVSKPSSLFARLRARWGVDRG